MQNGRALLNTCYTVTEPPEQLTASACNLWALYTVYINSHVGFTAFIVLGTFLAKQSINL